MDEPDDTRKTRSRSSGRKTRTTRRFRQLEKRPQHLAPAPIAWTVGTLLGAAAGAALHGLETVVLRAAGVAVPSGDDAWTALGLSAAAGAVAGAWAAASGLYGPRWASSAAVTAAGWLASGALGAAVASLGLPAWLGVGVGALAAIAAGQVAGRLPAPAGLHQGLAVGLLVALGLLVPLHASVLAGPTSPAAVMATGIAGVIALAAGAAAAAAAQIDRAPWLPIGAVGLLSLALHGALGLRSPPPIGGRMGGPTVVLVVISGLRADRVGALGGKRTQTPRLDAFTRSATLYTAAHASSNWTVPSLGSILTGRLPYSHGAGANDGAHQTRRPLRADVVPAARTLRRAGAWTVAVVSDPELRAYALDAGFARWIDDPGRGAQPMVLQPLGVAGLDPTGWPVQAPAEIVTERAIAALREAPPAAGLLLVQYSDASGPFSPTPSDEAAVGATTRPPPTDRYDAALRRVDRALGALLDAIPGDAWVIVVGDRGVSLGETRPPGSQGRIGAPYGHTMYEELLHVPLAARVPGSAARQVTEPVSVVDVAPTVLAALGVEPDEGVEGHRLSALFGSSRPAGPVLAQSTLFGSEQQAVISGEHKLVQLGGRATVYDLARDPAETTPLGTEGKDNDVRMRRMLALLPPPGSGATLTPPPPAALEIGRIGTRLWTGGDP